MEANCVDVSSYQGDIRWEQVKKAGVDCAILRSVLKNGSADSRFEQNYAGAGAAGIRRGVYLYAYAVNAAQAQTEARRLLELLNGRRLELPVFYDLETPALRTTDSKTVQGVASAFRGLVEEAGYTCAIYCDEDFYRTRSHFVGFAPECGFWIAKYGANNGRQNALPVISHPLLAHQFTSKGTVSGINGKVDVSRWYDLPQGAPLHPMDTLRRGHRGQQVVCLQMVLNVDTGADLVEDGIFGPATEAALLSFQRGCELTADGIVGPQTWTALLG